MEDGRPLVRFGLDLLFAAIDADIVRCIFGLAEEQQRRCCNSEGSEKNEHCFENFHVWTSL